MNFKETLATNDQQRELVETMAGAYTIPLDTLLGLCELMFDCGVYEQRLAMLEAKLSGD